LYILPPKKEVSARATWEGALLEKFLFFSFVREREKNFPPPPPKFFFEEEQQLTTFVHQPRRKRQ